MSLPPAGHRCEAVVEAAHRVARRRQDRRSTTNPRTGPTRRDGRDDRAR